MKRQELYKIRALIEKASMSLPDDDALEAEVLFPTWDVGIFYMLGVRVRYDEKLYKCVQGHTSQADWTPDQTPALWTDVAEPGEIPVWRQPSGAQDAYNSGDRVHYPDAEGPVYVSTIDANVWAPDVWGWTLEDGEAT